MKKLTVPVGVGPGWFTPGLTVAVKVVFFSKSVEISVEKRFGGSGGDPTFAQLVTSPAVWSEYAGAFA